MIQVRFEDTFLPHSGPTQAGLIQTASNGGRAGEGRSGVIFAQEQAPAPAIRSIQEAERELAVLGEVDVLVCGGGPAGTGAAIAAARTGASTLMIEQYGISPRKLDVKALRRALQQQGVELGTTKRPLPEWSTDQRYKPENPRAWEVPVDN